MRVYTHSCQELLVGNSYIVNWSWHTCFHIECENNYKYRLIDIKHIRALLKNNVLVCYAYSVYHYPVTHGLSCVKSFLLLN